MKASATAILIGAAMTLIAAIACGVFWGARATFGCLLGGGTALASILSFRLLAWLLGPEPGDNRAATRLTLILWLLKLPIIFGAVWLASRIGGPATSCFLGGLALVYSALVYAGLRHT